jgi:hypothetical protein
MRDKEIQKTPETVFNHFEPRSLRAMIVVLFLTGSGCALTFAQNGAAQAGSDRDVMQLVNDVVYNEIQAELHDPSLWRYREEREEDGTKKLLYVCETKTGEIDRLVTLNGEPLNAEQRAAEDSRIRRLVQHPEEMRQAEKKDEEDGKQERKLLRIFPQAFRFRYEGREGNLIKLEFVPNLDFHPSGHAAQVFHHMAGELIIDGKQKRLAEIDGRLISSVKFWGGLLGHLDAGGRFHVSQIDLGGGHWELSKLDVEMSGKALFFKTIAVREKELHTDFEPVSASTTLEQAVSLVDEEEKNPERAQKQRSVSIVTGAKHRRPRHVERAGTSI